MRYSEILHEAYGTKAQVDMTVDELAKTLISFMQRAVTFGQKYVVQATSVPAGPDTSKFRAAKSGMVEFERNLSIHGSYGSVTTYDGFLKIGGAIALPHKKEIKQIFEKPVIDLIGVPFGSMSTNVQCTDGEVVISEKYGTNWGGVGFFINRNK